MIIVPAKTKYQDIRKWVLETDEDVVNNPALVGLPPRAELMILAEVETGNGAEELNAIFDARDNDDDDADAAGAVPLWMKDLRVRAEKWLDDVPTKMETLTEKANSIKNPLFRFMRREFQTGAKTLKSEQRFDSAPMESVYHRTVGR